MELDGFILSRETRETRDGLVLILWAATPEGPARIVIHDAAHVCFIEHDAELPVTGRREPTTLYTLAGVGVDALYFDSRRHLRAAQEAAAAKGNRLYESDVGAIDRYLMERFIFGALRIEGEGVRRGGYIEFRGPRLSPSAYEPALTSVSLDIETSGMPGEIYTIALTMGEREDVLVVGGGPALPGVAYFPTERALLEGLIAWLNEHDPDLIIGWNIVGFDLAFIEARCEVHRVPCALGRGGGLMELFDSPVPRQSKLSRVPGRMVLDGIDLLRAATWSFESFALDDVAQELLGRGKKIDEVGDKLAEIQRLYAEDLPALIAYNREDTRLVTDIFEKAGLFDFAVARVRMMGLPLDRYGGSVAAFDFNYLPRLHREGYVAPSVGDNSAPLPSPGGYILDSTPGLYENVLVLDFKSLYPSIMLTFHVDPLGLALAKEDPKAVPGYDGATFHRTRHILPGLIERLWQQRDAAKRAKDAYLSQAIKILMNSFYGVMGTPACRFYEPKLVTSITRRGHEIIRRSKQFVESQGLEVLYGDTDSVFVLLGGGLSVEECAERGAALARDLNMWWKETFRAEYDVESRLEIEFETHYRRFLMPTMRGSSLGTKKRYAGLVMTEHGPEVVIRGLEAVRTDWTPLAREFQRELLRRVFVGEPYEDYVRDMAKDVLDGKHDDALVYRKRLRKDVADYTRNVPPHVQAARKMDNPGRFIRYVITTTGAEPADAPHGPLDYGHYLDRQLAPAADSVLAFCGTSFEGLTSGQMEMF